MHDLIEFQEDEFENALWGVIQTRPFQRLRRIKQLGLSDLVFPGATHSRFAHSVGAFHTARRLMKIIEEHLGRKKYVTSKAQQALAAALVHDLGHGPFSHAFEDVGRRLGLRMAKHENVSDALIRDGEVAGALKVLGSGFADDVASIIKAAGPGNIYSAVVSSQFDADRLDYMRRDRLMTGSQHSAIDFEWLVANLEVGEVPSGVDEQDVGSLETFVLGRKAVFAAESYVVGLFQLYPTIYFHKATRGAEKLFSELLYRVIALGKDGAANRTGLPAGHPLIRFARDSDNIDLVLTLDDTVVWGSLTLLADASDSLVRDLAVRLRDRKLYKALDVRERVKQGLDPDLSSDDPKAVDRACASIGGRIEEWLSEHPSDLPRILSDEDEREPYKKIQESKGPLNQIRIKTFSGGLVDLGERSKIVRAIEPFKFYRVYTPDEDTEVRQLIEDSIKQEVGDGGKK